MTSVIATVRGVLLVSLLLPLCSVVAQDTVRSDLDKRVQKFLDSHRHSWRDLNIPASDGRLLFDLIVKNKYTRALEIGTSTGRSGIWIAWALSKNGGKLITIEIDEDRYKEALENFKEAGLADFIDARLADAHELVPALDGPFDFVFCDADKNWYTSYFKAVSPKILLKGCYTAHNVSERGWRSSGTGEFLDYVRSRKNYTTTVDDSGGGVSISYKTAND